MYDPERYESNKSAALRDAEQFVPLLVQRMPWGKGELILDYGCGAGSTGNKLILPKANCWCSKILSVDISPEMIRAAKSAYSHPNVEFEVGDIMGDNFPQGRLQFDKIFAVYVLHFIKDYREALRRFYKILKPGGYFGFTVLTKSSVYYLYEQLGESRRWSEYMKGYEKYVPEWFEKREDAEGSWKESLAGTGFELVELKIHTQTYHFDSVEVASDLLLSLNPFIKRVPAELLSELRHEYISFYRKLWNVPANSDRFSPTYEMMHCVVRKPDEC